MNTQMNHIYPLNQINLQALMDYYFPFLPHGDVNKIYVEFTRYNLTLTEVEYAATRILPLVDIIQKLLGSTLTQTNLLDYAIESVLLFDFSDYDGSPERFEIVRIIREKVGIDQSYDEMLSRKNNLLLYRYWN